MTEYHAVSSYIYIAMNHYVILARLVNVINQYYGNHSSPRLWGLPPSKTAAVPVVISLAIRQDSNHLVLAKTTTTAVHGNWPAKYWFPHLEIIFEGLVPKLTPHGQPEMVTGVNPRIQIRDPPWSKGSMTGDMTNDAWQNPWVWVDPLSLQTHLGSHVTCYGNPKMARCLKMIDVETSRGNKQMAWDGCP